MSDRNEGGGFGQLFDGTPHREVFAPMAVGTSDGIVTHGIIAESLIDLREGKAPSLVFTEGPLVDPETAYRLHLPIAQAQAKAALKAKGIERPAYREPFVTRPLHWLISKVGDFYRGD